MKVLFTRFPLESAYGGAEVQTMSLMEGLRAKGHSVSFVGSCSVLLELCNKEGIPAAEVQIGPPPVTRWHVVSFLWRKRGMRNALARALETVEDPDVICMLGLSEKLLLTPLALQKNTPVVWIEHDRVGKWLTRNPWLQQLRALSRKVATIVVSELSRKMYLEMGWQTKNVVAIPNGIDVGRFGEFFPHPPTPSPSFDLRPHPPAPSPTGGRGDVANENTEFAEEQRYRKPPVHGGVLSNAREMRKNPTKAEEVLWEHLRYDQLGVRIRRQHPIGGRILDFYCHEAGIGIEIDGEIHESNEQKEKDYEREQEVLDQHIRLLRFRNEDVMNHLEEVLQTIRDTMQSYRFPSPSGGGVGGGGKGIHIGCIARLTHDKGIDVLIEAVKDMPNISLTIVGQGREESYIRSLVEPINQSTNKPINLLPSVADLGSFYASLDIFILPSRSHDPFGLAVAEAMLCGVSAIVTDQCGIASYLHSGTDALIVPAGDSLALKEAIRELEDAARRRVVAAEGRQTAEREFSYQRMIDSYEKIFGEIRESR